MQLYALDKNKKIIACWNAEKQENYTCYECDQTVRLRGGLYRQDHFYHVNSNEKCRQSQKSAEHIKTQMYLHEKLPSGECFIEHQFPEINRIADIVWENQKIIFEIQCSPISLEEVNSRNRDYESIGYEVIWIFHDKRYNKKRVTAAEYAVSDKTHYFTNIDENGEGYIYDRYSYVKEGIREEMLPHLKVNVLRVFKDLKRKYFEGDLYYSYKQGLPENYATEIKRIEKQYKNKETFYLFKLYRFVFNALLERCCI